MLSFHVKNIILPEQHGFMNGRSTVTNLVCKTQFINEILDQGGQVDVIYTDFSKAFDRLDHALLLSKLDSVGLSNEFVKLMKSYLTGRAQFVQHCGFRSVKFFQTSGVPQGSVLGPLMFVIFINDIVADTDVHYLLYADDLKLLRPINTQSDTTKLQNVLNLLNSWCTENKLPLNVSKCNVMSYSRRNNPVLSEYKLDTHILHRPEFIKDLGVTYDRKLSFTRHIECITASAYKSLGFVVRNMRDFQNSDTLCVLFNTFVRSKLEYASIVWSPIYNVHITSLEKIQRRFFKSAINTLDGSYPPRGTSQEIFYERFNMTSLEQRRTMQSVIFLFKIINNKIACENILAMLDFRVPRFDTRNYHLLSIKNHRSNLYKRSPIYQMANNYSKVESRVDILCTNINEIRRYFM